MEFARFFIHHRPTRGDWEFLTGVTGLLNELNCHFYDAAASVSYMMGSLSSSHHLYARKILLDTVDRYDFHQRSWASLGRTSRAYKECKAC